MSPTLKANFVIDKQSVINLKGLNCIVSLVDNQQPNKPKNRSSFSIGGSAYSHSIYHLLLSSQNSQFLLRTTIVPTQYK